MIIKLNIISAHKYSRNNREFLIKSNICGCFSCLKIFSTFNISNWTDNDKTAICPYCKTDSILPESSHYPITTEFLIEMKKYWFKE